MSNPFVSIILPVYNGEKYLSKSIESCLNQTYRNIELIIVNDCSTDKTLEIVDGYLKLDSRIKVLTNSANKRLPASLNIGHLQAQGDYITWTSDDNLYLPNAIEVMMNQIHLKKVDFVYADFIQINNKGKDLRVFKFEEPEELIWRNVIGACFMYSRELYEVNQGYNESLFMVEDYDFWLRAFMRFKFFHIDEILYKYRIHENSLTNEINDKGSEKAKIFEENKIKMYFEIFKKYNFPIVLGELICEFQKKNIINHHKLIKNRTEIQFFFKKNFKINYKKHLSCLKDKYIIGVRQNKKDQGVITFYNLLVHFGKVMAFNDFKTAFKILIFKFYKK
ncbi:MAG: glycosyltransferase involved in cell wall biosynthesis [Polaribacter sp.]|jgi:glycosyltransferase involved in cell wall biosynthesis